MIPLSVRLQARGFPKGFLKYNPDEVLNRISGGCKKKIYSWMKSLESDSAVRPWLYLYGEIGEYKTATAVAVSRLVIKDGLHNRISGNWQVYYRGCCELFDWLYDFKNTDWELWNSITKSGLLVIDDFGTEPRSLFVFGKIYQLLNYRYENNPLITIITSNFSLEQFIDRVIGFGYKQHERTKIDETSEYDLFAERLARRIANQSVLIEF